MAKKMKYNNTWILGAFIGCWPIAVWMILTNKEIDE